MSGSYQSQEWEDVPNSVYLGWDRATQLKYMILRDNYHMEYHRDKVGDLFVAEWFSDRAMGYTEELNRIIQQDRERIEAHV